VKIIIDREEIERVLSHLTIPDTYFQGNALARKVLERILKEHPYRTDNKGNALDEEWIEEINPLSTLPPTYVPPPVYGPIIRYCSICGMKIIGSNIHACSRSY
jgi:hypothetical protein